VTYYVALPFVFTDDGLSPGVAVECISASSAIMQAETLLMAKAMRALLHSAAQAIRRGEKDATVLKKFGDVRTI
jgi:hypothetical protein